MKKRVLVIGNLIGNLENNYSNWDIEYQHFLKPTNVVGSFLRSLFLKRNSKRALHFFCIDETAKKARNKDVVILFDSTKNYILSEYINRITHETQNSNTKLIFYFWNTISSLQGLQFNSKWEILTFDKIDSDKFGFRYVGGFYAPTPTSMMKQTRKSDIFFAGTDKGRFTFVRELENKLKNVGMSPDFHYVSKKGFFNKKYCDRIDYIDMLSFSVNAKCILDITSSKQYGLTLRFYEAIFYNKKLVTNHQGVKDYNFYNHHYIMVVTKETSGEEIRHFIDEPSINYSNDMKKQYLFETWLQRVIEGTEFNDTNK